MFVIRQAVVDDHSALFKLAKTVHFLNLPADPEILREKIVLSRKSFNDRIESERDRQFMFVLEDTSSGIVIGTSSIMSCISWPGHPEVFFKVAQRTLYSEDLQTGQVHTTLKLGTDESGPSELGGLILANAYRGHPAKLGALLGLIRFHFIGLHPEWFSERIIAELMPPVTGDKNNTLWEYLGRRFINLQYEEADRFSLRSKEFMLSLFPRDEIYISLLPPEARAIVGQVGKETKPARRMLESLGFKDRGHVDPFDGGPHLEAQRDEISLVKATKRSALGSALPGDEGELAFVSRVGDRGFRAVRCAMVDDADAVRIPAEAMAMLDASEGDSVGVTPLAARRAQDVAETGTAAS